MDDVLIAAGGIIPDADIAKLKEAGIAEIFGPGTEHRPDRRLLPRARAPARRGVADRGAAATALSWRVSAGHWPGC